jgi:hypothetical protein
MSEQGGGREAWEMMPREPSNAFAAYLLYQRLGPERSLERVRQEIGKGSVEGLTAKSKRWVETWSSRWGWVARARAWEAHEAALKQAAQERLVIEAEEQIKELLPEVVGHAIELIRDEQGHPPSRAALMRDFLDRAGVGKRKTEDKITIEGDLAGAIGKVLGAFAVKPKGQGGEG